MSWLLSPAAGTIDLGDLQDVVLTSAVKGDILVYSGVSWIDLPVGTQGQALTVNSATTSGLEWGTAGLPATNHFNYQFNTSTAAADPGTGYFSFNNADPSLASFMYISETDADGVLRDTDLHDFLINGQIVRYQDNDDATNRGEMLIISGSTDFGGYRRYAVADLPNSGPFGQPANDQECQLYHPHKQFVQDGTITGNNREMLIWNSNGWYRSGTTLLFNASNPPQGGRIRSQGASSNDPQRSFLFMDTGNSTSNLWFCTSNVADDEGFFAQHIGSATPEEFGWWYKPAGAAERIFYMDINRRLNIDANSGLFMDEKGADHGNIAGKGEFWVLNSIPNAPMFTSDTGVDHNLLSPSSFTPPLVLGDNEEIQFGDTVGGDAQLLHTGTDMQIRCDTGGLRVDGMTSVAGNNTFRIEGTVAGIYTEWSRLLLQTIVNPSVDDLPFFFARGQDVRIFDTSNTDYQSQLHDGADFVTSFATTADWQIGAGLTGEILIASGVDLHPQANVLFDDSDQIIFGDGGDCTLEFDASNMVLTSAVGSFDLNLVDMDLNMADNFIRRAVLDDYAILNDDLGTVTDANQTLTYSDGPAFELDLENWTANRTITLSGGPFTAMYGQMVVKIQQDGTSARTITWAGGSFVWRDGAAHVMNSTLNGISIFTFETWDGGTTWYAAGADYS